jgi:hypothetical protein
VTEPDYTQESPSTPDLSAAEFKSLFGANGGNRHVEAAAQYAPRIDNPEPAVHRMTMLGDVDIGSGTLRFAKDFIGVDYHNESHSHIDALCHVAVDGVLYLHLLDYLQLEDLAASCERHRRWEFLLVAAPLRIAGGTGPPLNPIAVF